MAAPADLLYTAAHEWVRVEDGFVTVGVTAYAVDALGDVVLVDLLPVGSGVTAGQPCGEIESTKAVSDVYAPGSGTIVEVNPALTDTPGLVNDDPYGTGWLFRLSLIEPAEGLLDNTAYDRLTDGGQ